MPLAPTRLNRDDYDSVFGAPTPGAFAGDLSVAIDHLCRLHPDVAKKLRRLAPVQAAAAFGALLTIPEWQASCFRLEALVHMALALASGRARLTEDVARTCFDALGDGPCGMAEDPAEDLFAGTVRSPRGNFRVLEGVWEASCFLLQRVIEVVDAMPTGSGYDDLRNDIHALLMLSDMVCERSGIGRHHLGGEMPVDRLDKRLLGSLEGKTRRIRFTLRELEKAGIDPLALAPFVFATADCSQLRGQKVGASELERRPLIREGDSLYLVLPTAVSSAIRYHVIERMEAAGMLSALRRGIANEYARHFAGTQILGGRFGTPLSFEMTDHGGFAASVAEVDEGRYLNLIFFTDHLADIRRTGLAGMNPDARKLGVTASKYIAKARKIVSERPGFVSGINFLVGCGIGRGVDLSSDCPFDSRWQIEFASAYDLDTLSWTPKFRPLSLWRLLGARDKLTARGARIQNLNGLLNLVAWGRDLDGHLVPHADLPSDFGLDGRGGMIIVNQNSQRMLRHEVATVQDIRCVQDVGGRWLPVRRDLQSDFADDREAPSYATEQRNDEGWIQSVHLAANRAWWGEMSMPEDTPGPMGYERWRVVGVWLSRAAPVLDVIEGLPAGPIKWRAEFGAFPNAWDVDVSSKSFETARAAISVSVDRASGIVTTTAGPGFDEAIHHPENIAERALVDALIEGILELAGQGDRDRTSYRDAIVPNKLARQAHAFAGQGFRDFIHGKLARRVTGIDPGDDAALKIGLGWTVRDRELGGDIKGKADTTAFLNNLVRSAEEQLCAELRQLDRRLLLERLVGNHEAAAFDRDRWRRTSSAMLALHRDRGAALETIGDHEFGLNAVFQTSRMLMEMAICECPIEGGRKPGELDLSKLMAMASMIFHMGGWSDAIRWDVMEPALRITPLGDVHARLDFVDTIITPHARETSDVRVEDAAENYPEYLQRVESTASVEPLLDAAFVKAWKAEFGFSFDDLRLFLDWLENRGIRLGEPVMHMVLSDFAGVEAEGRTLAPDIVSRVLDMLTLASRPSWRGVPDGFTERDRQPWRYRRRLSAIRRPVLQIADGTDVVFLVAPGMVRESLYYIGANYLRGDFPDYQLGPEMRAWAGKQADIRGAAFTRLVAESLAAEGWEVETEVRITKILNRRLDKDYGDVDVLAWRKCDGRVLVIECKDLQFRKTYGEICEQLADFRGGVRSNDRPDLLLKHLTRMDILSQRASDVAAYLKLGAVRPALESHLVFKHPVPMKYALSRLEEKVTVSIFDDLRHISGSG